MCFTTKNPRVLVASQDIPVYKIVQKNNAPEFLMDRIRDDIFQRGDRVDDNSLVTEYEPGKLYEDSGATLEAVHDRALGFTPKRIPAFKISRGFHSYAEINSVYSVYSNNDYAATKQVEFVIPAGARYIKGQYFDGRDVYISDKIRAGNLSIV